MLSLNAALDEWRLWPLPLQQRPSIIKKIKTGLTNHNYIICTENLTFVLRINNPRSTHLGINRYREDAIVKTLSQLNIAPRILYNDPASRYSVFEFLKGRTWSAKDFASAHQKQKLKTLIQHYQSITLPNTAHLQRDYHAYFQHYQHQISRTRLSGFRNKQKSFLRFKRWLRVGALLHLPAALTHHDITPGNIIETDTGLKIVDWEYAAIGWPQLDTIFLCKHPTFRKNSAKRLINEAHAWAEEIWWLIRRA